MTQYASPVRPMLAVPGKPFSGEGWLFEPKFDGVRCIASIRKQGVILWNRRLSVISQAFPEIVDALPDAVNTDCILDGEIIIVEGGKPDISAILKRMSSGSSLAAELKARSTPAQYIIFDILELDGESLISLPLIERKQILARTIRGNDRIALTVYVEKSGEIYFEAAQRSGFEGVVAKRIDSPYLPGVRSTQWIKFRKSAGFDLVIGGYTKGHGSRSNTFGALLLGAFAPDGTFVYVGRAGSGFSLQEASTLCRELKRTNSPLFSNPPEEPDIQWTLPELVVEVKALEVTRANILRFPVFLRLRSDKSPGECTLDQITGPRAH